MEQDRFVVAGTHIGDRQDPDWKPQAGTHIAAKMIADKLNDMHRKVEGYKCDVYRLEDELAEEFFTP